MSDTPSLAGAAPVSTPYRLEPRQVPSRSFARIAWDRFRTNPVAVVSATVLILLYVAALTAPWLAPFDPNRVSILNQHERPSAEHWLGTDENGRDELSRLLYGARISMTVGFVAMVLGLAIGAVIGSLAGYFGGWVDAVLMRLTDGMLAIPYFFLILIVVAVFGSSLRNIVLVIGVTSWMAVARIVRSEVLRFKQQDFVLAARALGVGSGRILARHIVPHTVPSVIVAATLGIANAILLESALSYLGLGIKPPQASWGNMLSNSQAYLWDNPLLPIYPGVLIFISVLAFNFLGDALRDALDPRLRS
jgi:peptide/nickel transport system permease protein